MRKKIGILLLNIGLLLSMGVSAQNITVKGKVTEDSGAGLPGVNVVEKGTTNGVVTSSNGEYTISVAGNATLVFSFIGMESIEYPVNGRKTINITMDEKSDELDEVVVVGYGTQKKESIVSAIDQVSGDDLVSSGVPNITSALSGLSPGMNVIVQSGQPGDELGKIYIRGRSDFSNDQALVLIDGIEQVVDLSSFDPSEIESISVLKDAAATAVYGVKGANGVVIITTKRGKKQKPKITYSGEMTMKRTTFQPDMLNAYEGKLLQTRGQKNDQMWDAIIPDFELEYYRNHSLPYLYPDVDWWKEMIKDAAYSHRHNVALNGGNDFIRYHTAINFLSEGDIYRIEPEPWMDFDPSFDYKRLSLRNNMDFQLTKTTELKTSFSGQVGYKNSAVGGNNWGTYEALYLLPNSAYPVYFPQEAMLKYPDLVNDPYMEAPEKTNRWSYDKVFSTIGQPYNSLHRGQIIDKMNSLSGDLELVQKLDFFIKGLEIRGKFNYSTAYTFAQRYEVGTPNTNQTNIVYRLYLRDPSDVSSYVWERSDLGDANIQQASNAVISNENMSNKHEVYYYRTQLNYQNKFKDHEVTGMALFSRRKASNNFNFPYYNEDWVTRFTYNFKYRYFAEFSGAYNGDEAFQDGKKFMFFPAYALGWNIAHEKIVSQNLPWLNSLKLRYSYGKTGSASGAPRWGYFGEYGEVRGSSNTYGQTEYFVGWQFGETYENNIKDVIGPISLATVGATWAVTTKENLGIDYSLIDGKISGNVEFFRDKREGIFIAPKSIPDYLGLTVTPPKIGVGEIKKHGYEMSLTYRDRTTWGFRYSLGGTFGFNENRVVYNDDLLQTPEYQKTEGKPISTTTLYQVNGLFNSIDEIVNYAEFVSHSNPSLGDIKPVDYNADGVVDRDDQVKLNLKEVPLNNYSITLSGSYKGFSARLFCTGVFNYNMVENIRYAYPLTDGFATGRSDQMDYWTPSNFGARLPIPHANPDNYTAKVGANSDRVINMSYFRIKNVEFSYDLKPSFLEAVSNMQVYVNGNNLFTFTQFEYGDPEGKNVGSGQSHYPILQRYNLGIRLTF